MACDVFLSYTHVKDVFGNVAEFSRHLENELQLKTGNTGLRLFRDKVDIQAGDAWRSKLEAELASARMLIILVSPTWLNSKECIWEFEQFVSRPGPDGAARTVVPVIWDEVQALSLPPGSKALLERVKASQAFSWESLKYKGWNAAEPNEALARLAKDLAPKLMP